MYRDQERKKATRNRLYAKLKEDSERWARERDRHTQRQRAARARKRPMFTAGSAIPLPLQPWEPERE